MHQKLLNMLAMSRCQRAPEAIPKGEVSRPAAEKATERTKPNVQESRCVVPPAANPSLL